MLLKYKKRKQKFNPKQGKYMGSNERAAVSYSIQKQKAMQKTMTLRGFCGERGLKAQLITL